MMSKWPSGQKAIDYFHDIVGDQQNNNRDHSDINCFFLLPSSIPCYIYREREREREGRGQKLDYHKCPVIGFSRKGERICGSK